MTPHPEVLLDALRCAVRAGKPIPDLWREPLAELLRLLMGHPDGLIAASAVATVLEMEAANLRLDRIQ